MRRCPRCHAVLGDASLGGNCAACLVGLVFSEPPVEVDGGDELPGEGLPRTLGSYEILSEVGRGGSSVVYRARQQGVNRLVALKVLQGSILARRDALERLRVEAEAVGRLEHPHIVPLYEVGRADGLPFLALRLHEHGSLADALKRRRFTPEEAARFVATVAGAVHHAHQRGVLHRDIKPSNLLLDAEGRPHVADFGLAKLADGDSGLTLTTTVLGTPSYMAPEQAGGRAREAGVPADVHALGVILFELLTGRVPFAGASTLEVLRSVAEEEAPRARSLNPAIDPDLEAICQHCLEKVPEHRYASAAELAADLGRWLRREPTRVRPGTALQRVAKWVRRRPLVSALAFSAAVFLLAGLGVSTWQWQRARAAATQARAAERLARRTSHAADMALASSELERNPGLVRELLERHRPAPGQEDLRGWEWRYLWAGIRSGSGEVFCRRTNSVFSLVITPDGRWAGLGEFNGGFSLWEVGSRREVWADPDPVGDAGMHDGTRVAVSATTGRIAYSFSSRDGAHEVRILDPVARKIVMRLPLDSPVRMLACMPDGGRWVVTTGPRDAALQVWDAVTGKRLHRWPVPLDQERMYNRGAPLALSPDGLLAAVDDQKGGVVVIELATGLQRAPLKTSRAQVCAMAFSPDGRQLAVGASYNEPVIRLWDLETGRMQAELEGHHGWISGLVYLPGNRLLSSSQDQSLRVWDLERCRVVQVLRGHTKEVWSVAVGPELDTVFSGSKDGEVRRWSLQPSERGWGFHEAPLDLQPWATLPAVDGGALWGVTRQGHLRRISGPGFRKVENRPEFGTNLLRLWVVPDGEHLLTADREGNIAQRRLDDGRVVHHLRTTPGSMPAVSPDASRRIYVHDPSVARVRRLSQDWTGFDGEWEVPQAGTYMGWRLCGPGVLSLHQDGRFIVSDVGQGGARTGRLNLREPMSFAVSPDLRQVAVSSDYGEVHLMNADLDRELGRLGGYIGAVRGIAFSPDGRRLATGASGPEALRLWDLETRQMVLQLPAEATLIHPLNFSADGNTLWGIGAAGELVAWTAPSWEEIRRIESAPQVPR